MRGWTDSHSPLGKRRKTMIERTVTRSGLNTGACGNGTEDVAPRRVYGLRKPKSLRQIGGYRRRQGATGTMNKIGRAHV